jgi:hypothetical protein
MARSVGLASNDGPAGAVVVSAIRQAFSASRLTPVSFAEVGRLGPSPARLSPASNHGAAFKHRRLAVGQPVNAGGEGCLHGGRDLDLLDRVREPVVAALPSRQQPSAGSIILPVAGGQTALGF